MFMDGDGPSASRIDDEKRGCMRYAFQVGDMVRLRSEEHGARRVYRITKQLLPRDNQIRYQIEGPAIVREATESELRHARHAHAK